MKASEIHNKSMSFQAIIQRQTEEFYIGKFYSMCRASLALAMRSVKGATVGIRSERHQSFF